MCDRWDEGDLIMTSDLRETVAITDLRNIVLLLVQSKRITNKCNGPSKQTGLFKTAYFTHVFITFCIMVAQRLYVFPTQSDFELLNH